MADQSMTFAPVVIGGEAPPAQAKNYWPWLLGAGFLVALWFLTSGGGSGPLGV